MTRVVHCKKEPYDIYIGRPSKWSNPFVIGKDGTREEVIKKYIDWFEKQEHLYKSIPELIDKTLACWCSPQACHGDYLCMVANKYKRIEMIYKEINNV